LAHGGREPRERPFSDAWRPLDTNAGAGSSELDRRIDPIFPLLRTEHERSRMPERPLVGREVSFDEDGKLTPQAYDVTAHPADAFGATPAYEKPFGAAEVLKVATVRANADTGVLR